MIAAMRRFLLASAIALALGILIFLLAQSNPAAFRRLFAGIFFVPSITEADLRGRYAEALRGGEKLKVLIVAGHDEESWGTEYRGLREAELTAELAQEIASALGRYPAFEPILVRDEKGYAPEFASQFTRRGEIERFIVRNRSTMRAVESAGLVDSNDQGVLHNAARPEAAHRLYAINLWANEKKIPLVVHIHFNDYPGRRAGRPGAYAGFAVYVPERQFSNARASRLVAEAVFSSLSSAFPTSTLRPESVGVIEDQELIAIGANNSLDSAAFLVEYGYIYEPQWSDADLRPLALRGAAFKTAAGIADFFNPSSAPAALATVLLPYQWKTPVLFGAVGSADVFLLQSALRSVGMYPAPGKTLRDCPITGAFGPCTREALTRFQRVYGISPSGGLDQPTRAVLNDRFGK